MLADALNSLFTSPATYAQKKVDRIVEEQLYVIDKQRFALYQQTINCYQALKNDAQLLETMCQKLQLICCTKTAESKYHYRAYNVIQKRLAALLQEVYNDYPVTPEENKKVKQCV
jgi:hypothetical protein